MARLDAAPILAAILPRVDRSIHPQPALAVVAGWSCPWDHPVQPGLSPCAQSAIAQAPCQPLVSLRLWLWLWRWRWRWLCLPLPRSPSFALVTPAQPPCKSGDFASSVAPTRPSCSASCATSSCLPSFQPPRSFASPACSLNFSILFLPSFFFRSSAMKKRGPRIRILAGPSPEQLVPVQVNADQSSPLPIKTDKFEGLLTVRVKNFADANGDIYRDTETNYFLHFLDATWSIQVQGRFLEPTNVDDCVFGNVFEKPIRDRLPIGTGVALKAISYIDPSLESDLYADQPWAWSPLMATMNFIRTERLESDDSPLPPWSGLRPVEDCTSLLPNCMNNISQPYLRRKFLSYVENRKPVDMGPRDFINAEFANGFLDFSTLKLKVPVVNVSFNLDKLWDGQPVRYMCLSRSTRETYFMVEFQIAALEADNNLEEDEEDENDEQTPEQSETLSRRATRGNSAATRPPDDDLPPLGDWEDC